MTAKEIFMFFSQYFAAGKEQFCGTVTFVLGFK
jgi:hypothetical protein